MTGALVNPSSAAKIKRAVAGLPEAGPFARLAPLYRRHGHSPVPVRLGSKAPHISDWSRWCKELPPEELVREWAERYPDAGLALALGPACGVCALDLDHDMDGLHARILAAAGPSPVAKKGQKGATEFYRYTGEKSRSYRRGSQTIAEILAGGRLVIVPPTVHPGTGKPYVWLTAVTLLDVAADALPPLNAAAVAALFEPPAQPPRRRKSNPPREGARAADPGSSSGQALAQALSHIPPCLPYHDWVRVGMALKSALGDAGFELWDKWSSGSPKYPGRRETEAKWRSFSGQGVTVGTLFHIAKLHGWRRNRR
jgi:hypothetical protein